MTTSLSPNVIVCPKEYQTSEWGQTLSNSDVWEGPMDELLNLQADIRGAYTTTQLVPTKGGHGKLTATITTVLSSAPSGPPKGDISIEVEWAELRKPVETNPAFDDFSAESKALIRKYASDGKKFTEIPMSFINPTLAENLFKLIASGTTEWSTGVPVVRRTTKNASNIVKGFAWYRDTPPATVPRGGSGGEWEWMKTVDRRTRVGADIQMIEEWTGAVTWDATLYPTS